MGILSTFNLTLGALALVFALGAAALSYLLGRRSGQRVSISDSPPSPPPQRVLEDVDDTISLPPVTVPGDDDHVADFLMESDADLILPGDPEDDLDASIAAELDALLQE